MDHFQLKNGELYCEDVPLADIGAEVGTPVYVYSTATMCRHVAVLRAALDPLPNPLIAYAVKANPNNAVIATLAKAGLGADVVSGGEYRRATAAGVARDKIVFSGVGKTEEEMRLALEGGLYQFNLESLDEAEMLSAVASTMGRTAPVGFRVNPDVAAGGHAKITTGAAENKFGIAIGEAVEAYERIAQLPGLNVQGVAVHIGSQLTDLAPLERAFIRVGELIGELRAAGHDINVADLGGGLGVPYDPGEPPPPSPDEYGATVKRVAGGWNARLVFEPGRLIVANAGVLLSRVIRVKPGATDPFVILDAAMNDLMRPAMYGAWHDFDAVAPSGERMTAHIVGPICETGDTFAMDREIDALATGELAVFRTAGAYGATMASSYNSRGFVPEVLVDGDRFAVVADRIDPQAIMDAERVPEWL